jgi:hypothetical protein
MKRAIVAALAAMALTAPPLAAQAAPDVVEPTRGANILANGESRFKELFASWKSVERTAPYVEREAEQRRLSAPSHPSQGYTPCDSSHPDYGGMDYMACMMKRGELSYDRELMGVAKLQREARRQMRQFCAEWGCP